LYNDSLYNFFTTFTNGGSYVGTHIGQLTRIMAKMVEEEEVKKKKNFILRNLEY